MSEPQWVNQKVECCTQCQRHYRLGTKTCPICGRLLVPKVVRVPVEEE